MAHTPRWYSHSSGVTGLRMSRYQWGPPLRQSPVSVTMKMAETAWVPAGGTATAWSVTARPGPTANTSWERWRSLSSLLILAVVVTVADLFMTVLFFLTMLHAGTHELLLHRQQHRKPHYVSKTRGSRGTGVSTNHAQVQRHIIHSFSPYFLVSSNNIRKSHCFPGNPTGKILMKVRGRKTL